LFRLSRISMESSRFPPARPDDSVLLQTETSPDPSAVATGFAFSTSPGDHGMSTLRQTTEGAVHLLLSSSSKAAVLLARDWHVLGIPFGFEHMALYEEIAASSHCFIVTVTRPEAGG